MRKPLSILLVTTFVLTSCSAFPEKSLPDVPIFQPLAHDRAYYVYTISDKEGFVDNKGLLFHDEKLYPRALSWKDIQQKGFFIPNFSMTQINQFIEEICVRMKKKCKKYKAVEKTTPKK